MNGLRANTNRTGDLTSLDALNRTIESLEARIDNLITGAASRQTQRTDVAQPMPARDATRFDPVSEIRRRQQALDAKWSAPAERAIERPHERPVARSVARAVTPPENPNYSRSRDPYAAPDLSQSFSTLRQELHSDLSDSLSREMQALRSEIKAIRTVSDTQRAPAADISGELSRLQSSIERLGTQRNPESDRLRMDIEDLRMAVDQMARQDSVIRMEERWDGLEDHLRNIDTHGLQDEIMSLAYRLDDIKLQLGAFSDSPSIVAVEGKLIALAELVEKLGHHMQPNDQALSEQFAALDNRLDEISRAIAATSSRPLTQNIDNAVAQRIESRLNMLGENLDALSEAASRRSGISGSDFNQRIETLTARVEDLAKQRSVAKLEERLEQLSGLIESRQSPAIQPEITSFLSGLSDKIDALEPGNVSQSLDARLEQLSRQIEEMDERFATPTQQPSFDSAFLRIEERLGDIATRIDESIFSGASDNETLLGLESQIAHLSSLISQPSYQDPGSMTAQIDNRMSAIEEHLSTNDDYIVEVARQAAEAVLDSYMRNHLPQGATQGDMQMLTGLANDLRNLETLTKTSEARTHKTFEALHDTLVQIAARLDTLDQRSHVSTQASAPNAAPAAMPMAPMPRASFAQHGMLEEEAVDLPASAIDAFLDEAEADIAISGDHKAPSLDEKRGLIKSLTSRFRNSTAQPAAAPEALPAAPARVKLDTTPSIDPTEALEAAEQQLLEPGSGQPDIKQILERVRSSQASSQRRQPVTPESRADIIAAARRAAAAAALESVDSDGTTIAQDLNGHGTEKSRSRFRRPLLLGIGAILLALLALPVVKTVSNSLKTPQTAIELNSPASDIIEAPLSTSSIMQPGATDAAAQKAADLMEQQAASMPPAIDERVIGGAALPKETLGSGAPIDSLDRGMEHATTASLDIPAAIQPQSLADAARQGDTTALFEIASRLIEGRSGVSENSTEAASFFKRAADNGHAMSQYRLASMYEKATGVDQNFAEARRYYELAANQGNAGAMHNLAVMLTSNALGTPDYTTAAEWFTKAAEFGVSDSQYNLAILYARGSGVKSDLEQAYHWFAAAARDGDSDAAEKRDQIAEAMPANLLDRAKAKFASWQPKPLNEDANSVNVPDAWTDGGAVPTASVDMEKAIRNIQAILNKNGFDAGDADGRLGLKTTNAIKAFQTSAGIEPDGRITDKLVTALLERNK